MGDQDKLTALGLAKIALIYLRDGIDMVEEMEGDKRQPLALMDVLRDTKRHIEWALEKLKEEWPDGSEC